jgi:hypothetical protein
MGDCSEDGTVFDSKSAQSLPVFSSFTVNIVSGGF